MINLYSSTSTCKLELTYVPEAIEVQCIFSCHSYVSNVSEIFNNYQVADFFLQINLSLRSHCTLQLITLLIIDILKFQGPTGLVGLEFKGDTHAHAQTPPRFIYTDYCYCEQFVQHKFVLLM